MHNSGKLAGKTIFVTGGSRGIGKAIALKAARDKANIIIAAKTVDPHPKLEGTIFSAAKEIEAAGGQCLPVQVDVREEAQVEEAVASAVKQFGGLDILVNNASAIFLAGTLETPMKRYDLMNQINARGTYLTSKVCLPHLLKSQNAHILNLSPPISLNPLWFKGNLAYTMAKYGMSMCVLGMAEEFKDQGVAVNALWPRTAIWTAAMELMAGDQAAKECRKPEICADAFYAIVTKDSRKFTGNFCIDDEVLTAAGVTDLSQYAIDPTHKLMPDFFLDDSDTIAQGMEKISKKVFLAKEQQPPQAGVGVASIFATMGQKLKANPDAALKGIYAFEIGGKPWFVNVETGEQGQALPPSTPACTLILSEEDFVKMFQRQLQSASAFMSGRLKIKGDMQAALKLDKILAQLQKH